jgi:hypothetical protein
MKTHVRFCAHFEHYCLKIYRWEKVLGKICREEWEFWVSHDGFDKDWSLLEYDAVSVGKYLLKFRRSSLPPSSVYLERSVTEDSLEVYMLNRISGALGLLLPAFRSSWMLTYDFLL